MSAPRPHPRPDPPLVSRPDRRPRPDDVAAVVVGARRTPIGTAGRALADVEAADLAAPVLAALSRETEPIGAAREVVLGNCMGPGGDVARVAALSAWLPATTPAITVDRQCASGLAAVVAAVDGLAREPGLVLAGGVESVSTAPWRLWPPREGREPQRYERAPFSPAQIGDPEMGWANDVLAEAHGITRERQDRYAATSHSRAVAACAAGAFDGELVTVAGLDRDERPRAGLTPERLARLRPAFREGGSVTAGNSCGVNDGAAAVAVVDPGSYARALRDGALTTPTALGVRATASAACDPREPGLGLVPAVGAALDRAGVRLDEVAVVELNEAFAGQVLACCDVLGLDPARVCPEGGALALGHPWGASGAVLMVRLFAQLGRLAPGSLGLAAISAGGGQGVAVVVERLPGPGERT